MIRILYQDDAGVVETIELLDLEPTHELSATPTEHPVDDGSDVTDHIKAEADSFSCRCLISDSLFEAAGTHMGDVVSTSIDIDGMTAYGFSAPVERVQLVFDALGLVMQRRSVVTIETGRKRYESMAITRLSFPERNADGIEFTLEAKRIRMVATRTLDNPRPAQTRGHRRATVGWSHPQTMTSATRPTVSAPQRSGAAALLDGVRR